MTCLMPFYYYENYTLRSKDVIFVGHSIDKLDEAVKAGLTIV